MNKVIVLAWFGLVLQQGTSWAGPGDPPPSAGAVLLQMSGPNKTEVPLAGEPVSVTTVGDSLAESAAGPVRIIVSEVVPRSQRDTHAIYNHTVKFLSVKFFNGYTNPAERMFEQTLRLGDGAALGFESRFTADLTWKRDRGFLATFVVDVSLLPCPVHPDGWIPGRIGCRPGEALVVLDLSRSRDLRDLKISADGERSWCPLLPIPVRYSKRDRGGPPRMDWSDTCMTIRVNPSDRGWKTIHLSGMHAGKPWFAVPISFLFAYSADGSGASSLGTSP